MKCHNSLLKVTMLTLLMMNVFVISCKKAQSINDQKIELPKEVSLIVEKIKKVEYTNANELLLNAKELSEIDDEYSKLLAKYYTLKANFLREYTIKSLNNYNAIYNELKTKKLYKLMAETDILSTYFYYSYRNYTAATENVERSFDYCFEPDMFLERQALIYGISSTALINSPEEKKKEILNILDELDSYPWSIYHSRIYKSLATVYYYLKEYDKAKEVILKSIQNNKVSQYNIELALNYELLAPVEHQLSKDYESYVNYHKKSIEAKSKYPHYYELVNYRMIAHKYYSADEFDKAYQYYKKAIKSKNVDASSLSVDYAYLGWSYFKMDTINNYTKANEYYDKALTYVEPGQIGHKMALERKIWSLRTIDRKEEAKKYELELLSSQNLVKDNQNDNRFKDFQINTILVLKSKDQRLNNLQKVNNLQAEKLRAKKVITVISISLAVMSILLLYLLYNVRKNYKKNKKLTKKLGTTLSQLEFTNTNLEAKNIENISLLKLNERTLFSKVLKISTYKDSINSLARDVSKLIESNQPIKANNLFRIEKALKSLISEEEIWDDFKIQFEKTRPDFFKKLKLKAPDLSVNELKHCTYIISKLKTKEVASLINVSPRSVETARYRIKKKMGLNKSESLFDFLQGL